MKIYKSHNRLYFIFMSFHIYIVRIYKYEQLANNDNTNLLFLILTISSNLTGKHTAIHGIGTQVYY